MNQFERSEKFCACVRVRVQPTNVLVAARDLCEIEQGLAQPLAQTASAHRRARKVERSQQRRRAAHALEDFEAAERVRVEQHVAARVIA